MPTVRPGSKAVLLVVDAQVGVMQGTWQARRVIENFRLAVKKARRLGVERYRAAKRGWSSSSCGDLSTDLPTSGHSPTAASSKSRYMAVKSPGTPWPNSPGESIVPG